MAKRYSVKVVYWAVVATIRTQKTTTQGLFDTQKAAERYRKQLEKAARQVGEPLVSSEVVEVEV